MRRGAGSPGPRLLPRAVNMRWSARWLDADSLGGRFPYRIARVVVRELPGADTPAGLARDAPAKLDEGLHLGYAVQWFAIALVVLGGGVALALRKPAR
jgi:cytochrome oxidase assembly protein ShyY1